MTTIFDATVARCIEEQTAARNAHVHVYYEMRDPRLKGQLYRACHAQEVAADCYKQMWIRLERLIGVA